MAQEKTTPSNSNTPSQAPKAEEKTASTPAANTAEKKEETKPAAKKATKSTAKKKSATKKTAAKKSSAKKTTAKKAATKTAVKKKSTSKKSTAKKSQTTKSAANKKPASATKQAQYITGATNQTMEKIMTQVQVNMEKFAQDATEMGRQNFEAMVQSGTVFAQGFENIMRTAMSFAQNSAEKQGKFMKEALSSKTLNELTEVQNKIVQTNFDDFMSGATKLTELSVKTLNDTIEPINAQATKGMQKAQKMAA